MTYPWAVGDALLAADLNAAIANAGGMNGGLNVRDYGAVGDGVANDTLAFNNAIGAAYDTKTNLVVIPAGLYRIDPLIVSPGVVLRGAVPGPLDPPVGGPSFLVQPIGATLLVNSHGAPLIQLNTSNGLFDVIIYDPLQVAPTATAPVVAPPMVLMQSPSRMSGVTLINAFIGVSVRSGRCIVANCYIGAYHTCVDVDQAGDVTYFNNIWCGVFYDSAFGLFPWQNMDNWVMNNNGVAFKFGRADAVSMVNCGCYIKWAGLYCIDGAGTLPGYGWIANFDADMCVYGAVIGSANASNGWQLSNFTALPVQGGPSPAATPLYMPTGGSSAPIVHWSGGSIGLGVPNYWTSSQSPIVNAGQLSVRGVSQLADRMVGGLGVFGHAPVTARPTVTGAKAGNAALTSLLTALAAYGLVTDSSS